MSNLMENDNNDPEGNPSAKNSAVSGDVCDSEKKSLTDCSTVSNHLCDSEENLSIDSNAVSDVSDSEKKSLIANNNNALLNTSNDVSESEKKLIADNNNEASNDVSESKRKSLTDNNNEASNDVCESKKKSLADNNSEAFNDASKSEKKSLTNKNNEVLNDVSESEKNPLTDNNEASNDVSESEKNPLTDNNEASNDVSESEKKSLTNNNNEALNSVSESEEKLFTNNNKALNDVSKSEKNSLTTDNNEASNNASDSEKNSISTDNNYEISNDASDSENSSNFDLIMDHVNDNVESTKTELVPEITGTDSNKMDKIRNFEASTAFEKKILEYEEVLRQCRVNLEALGKDNVGLRHEVHSLKIKLNRQEAELKKQQASMKSEFLANIEKLSRECNTLRKEKEAIVIRYANSEKEVIMDKKIQQDLEKKIKDISKDRECLLLKLKNASVENSKLSSSVENKMVEIAKLQKENEKLNADFNSREIRIKWLQNKLKNEVTAHQETQGKLEHTLHRLNEMREEAEQVRRDCQEMIKCYQEAEEIKSVKLDSQLKLKLTELEVQKQEKCDQEQVYMLLRQELDALKKKQRLAMDDNNSLTLKINSLEKERLEYEQTLCKLKDNQNLLKEEIADMTSKLAEMEGLKLQLEQEREKSAASLREVERLRLTNAELQSDLDACHVKEGDRLDFVEKITAKTMLLQSDHCLLEVKAQALEDEVNHLKKSFAEVQQNYTDLVVKYEDSKKEHEKEMQLLAQKLAEKAKSVEKLNTFLEEAENENRVLKRRHIASIKELSRELNHCKRRLESYESNYGIRPESVSLGSRTSSSASLHISSSNDTCQISTSPSITLGDKKETPSHRGKNGSPENQFTVDKEVLIERIINLQKMLAKKTDKIDFLEDHIEHLVKEMRKKSKSVDFKNV